MEKKNDEIMAFEHLAKLFSNDLSNDESIKPINEKIVEIEQYILSIDFKTLDLKHIAIYYDLLSKISMRIKNINSTREFLEITNKMKP